MTESDTSASFQPAARIMDSVALIPAYQEVRFIYDVVRAVLEVVPHVIVVDDGSVDGTAEEARRAGATILQHKKNKGKGAAIKTGLRHFIKNWQESYVVLLDGDGQHRPDEIPRFVEKARELNSPCLLIGNRMSDTREMPLVRILVNRFMSGLIGLRCGQTIPDSQCGFRLLHREVAPLVLAESDKFDYETEMLFLASRNSIPILPIPVSTVYGEETSKIRPVHDTIRFFSLLARYRNIKVTPVDPEPTPVQTSESVARH